MPLLCTYVDTKGHGCDKGNACRFCHTPRQVGEIYKTRKCTNWWYRTPGSCARGMSCRFCHDDLPEAGHLAGTADAEREAARQAAEREAARQAARQAAEQEAARQAAEQEGRQWNERARGAIAFLTSMIASDVCVEPGDAPPQVTAMIRQELRNAIAAARTTVYHRISRPDPALASASWRPSGSGCSRAVFDTSPHRGFQGEDFDIASQLPEDLSSCYMCT